MNTLSANVPEAAAAPAPTRLDSPHRIRILLVDDDVYVCELNAGVLVRAGYDVETAEDGVIASKMLNEARYNLLITDNRMPRMTGIELIRKLRAEDLALPVILTSGVVPVAELERHPLLTPDALLPKPFTTAELLAAVEKVLLAADGPVRSSDLFRECALKDIQSAPVNVRDPAPTKLAQRILVVDDDTATREVSVQVLARSGYVVKAVHDGAAGWSALLTGSFDLVLTDNKMPRMTGLEMIEKLRASRMTLPVIMATAHLPVQEFDRRPWLQPDATLERPFSTDELLATVKKVLGTDDGWDDQKESLIPKYL